MARLFAKDYHERSNSWFFNHAVIVFEEGDLWYWHTEDESGNILMRFYPTEEKRSHFSEWVELVYDTKAQKIREFHCAECGDDEGCRHYLSLLLYAYNYISDDIFKEEIIQTGDGDSLRGSNRLLDGIADAFFEIEGIYNPKQSKVRVYHRGFEGIDLSAYAKYLCGINPDKLSFPEDELFDENLKNFIAYLEQTRSAYSNKNHFWSLNKPDFAGLLVRMKPLPMRLMISETNEELVFAKNPFELSLRIEPAGKSAFRLSPVLIEELSAVYSGYPAWLFFRNKVYELHLPFTDEVIDKIFAGNMLLNDKDLVFYRTIVRDHLGKKNIYLDFDKDIVLPPIISTPPQCRIYIKPLGEDILLEGALIYDEIYEIPLSHLRFGKPLIYAKPVQYDEQMWFYLPYDLEDKVKKVLSSLPPAQTDRFEQKAQLLYTPDRFEYLKEAIFQMDEQEWDIRIADELSGKFVTKIRLEAEFEISRTEDIDWFSYNVSYRHKDLRFSHEELKAFFRSDEEFLHTVDGRIFYITNPHIFSEIDKLVSNSEEAIDNVYRARIRNLPYYQRLQEENPAFRIYGDDFIQAMFRDLKRRHLEEEVQLPLNLQRVLRGYQKSGIAWIKMLQNYGLNGILADEMGLGKTIQALALVASTAPDRRSIVICPKTLLYNWAAEIEKFHTNISYAIVEGSKEHRENVLKSPNIRLFLIGYSMVLSELEMLRKMDFEWIVLDEAQNIKNVSAQRTSAIKKLSGKHRLALSGTPIENNVTELWSIMDFLMPGYLGTLPRFKKKYAQSEDDDEARDGLHRQVLPFLLRRVKKDVLLELPDKQEQIAWAPMNPLQEKLYLQILDDVKRKLMPNSDEEMSYVHILAALTKLRQVCNHPHLANPDILAKPELSAKLELLLELVQDAIAGGHKILVFSQFVQMLKIIRGVFDEMGIKYSYLDGQTKNRAGAVQSFEEDEDIRVFLISLRTGGTGLNLTAADTVILYDPWWNPMVENQAIDRAHRIGQTKKVQVYKLITKNSVEEKIISLQKNKLDMFSHVIEGGAASLKAMSIDDLRSLFD